MPYSVQARKLHRVRKQRRARVRIMASNLILKSRIKTTEAKAKTVKPFVERLVTVAKKGTLDSNRRLASFLPKEAVKVMMTKIGPAYKDRKGGYTRIIRIGQRVSDNSRMVFLEFVK